MGPRVLTALSIYIQQKAILFGSNGFGIPLKNIQIGFAWVFLETFHSRKAKGGSFHSKIMDPRVSCLIQHM
jgi:hypothetical protein